MAIKWLLNIFGMAYQKHLASVTADQESNEGKRNRYDNETSF